MKIVSVLGFAILLMASCSQTNLEKEEAASVIRSEKNYPKVYEYEVNVSDPASARKLLDAGLEAEGLVTIDKTQKLKDELKSIQVQLIDVPLVEVGDSPEELDKYFNNKKVNKKYRMKRSG